MTRATLWLKRDNQFISLKNLDSGVINIGSTTTIVQQYLMPY